MIESLMGALTLEEKQIAITLLKKLGHYAEQH
jgi:hypothetical protein